jgi:16S rRNA pseudouridine516 synthase
MKNTQRLDKILSNMGCGSRKEIKDMAKKGMIKVDEMIVKDPSQHVDPTRQEIVVNGEVITYRDKVYLMLHKPPGVISATEDSREETVVDLMPEYKHFSLFPVGRLDKDTEGLLLLTNDGKLAHELLSPKKHIPKLYFAKIKGVVGSNDVLAVEEGIVLDDGYKTLPGQLEIIQAGDISEIQITIHEGKFHQIKRMFAALDKEVIYLKRLAMGRLQLDDNLAIGHYRELSEEELQLLKEPS